MSTNESTPRVGRWNGTGWLCECRESMYNSPEADVCHFCHAVRPPLPETPAPRAEVRDDYGAKMWRQLEEMAQAVKQADADENAVVAWMWDMLGVKLKSTDAQVVGREPIAGVDDAALHHAVERSRHLAARVRDLHYAHPDPTSGHPLTGTRLIDYADCIDAVCAAALRAVPVEGGGGSLDDEIDRRVRLLQYDLTGDQMRAMLEVDDAGVCDFPALTRAAYERFAENYSGEETMATWDEQGAISQRMSIALFVAGFRSAALRAVPVEGGADAVDAARYRFLRDNPFQLRAIDGNAVWGGNVSAEDFDAHTDVAMANPAFTPTPSEDRPDAR